ncbi:hypothetical protein AMS68_003711 [Peltaster fructicola]|uniref:Beta-lactamase-related domain-containing protein n=1 Tax=Peltaster fructicola TaxID=286661 RepID=A0A6H0XTY2_9PEZI|nr:hypothetical protein AMS68_003711 [Peltaster fructicola]
MHLRPSQWSFHNVDKLIKTGTIGKSTTPTPLHEARDERIDALKVPLAEGQSLDVKSLLQASHTDGLVVLSHGKLVYEYYDHGNTASSKHILMSVSKSMTGLILGAMVAKGQLQVDEKVTRYMPELEKTAFAPATVRHLLDMRGGIKYPDNSHEYRMAAGWNPAAAGEKQLDLPTFFSTFNPPDTDAPPAGFVYASVSTDLIGLLLERVSGKSYAELAHELLWQPAGAECDAQITLDSSGNPRAAGGMCASVRDVARVGQALLEGKLASKEWIADMLSGGDTAVFAESAWGPIFEAFSSSLAYRSYWIASGEEQLLVALGIHGQMLLVDLKNEIVMAKTSSQPDFFDPKAAGLAFRLFRTLQHVLK